MYKRFQFLLLTMVVTILVSGCSFFNPEYHKPKVEVPSLWKSQDKNIESTKEWNLPQLAWWRNFNDPVLNSLITTALKDNQSLQVSIGNILQAEAEVKKANYAWLPTASVGGGGFIALPFDMSGTGLAKGIQGQTLGGSFAGVIPSYTINIAREFKMGEITRLGKDVNTWVKDATRLSIISRVSISYFSLLAAKRQLELQEQEIKILETLYEESQLQIESGVSSQLKSEEKHELLLSSKAKIALIKGDITHFENALRILTGRLPGKIDVSRTFEDINADIVVPVNLPSKVLESRPDIAIAEDKLKIANANIGLARSQFFPNIDLTGYFGNATLALGELATLNAWAWAAAAVAAMPVFNMSILADSDKAKVQYYEAYYDYISTLHQAFQDVEDTLVDRSASYENLKKMRISLKSAEIQHSIYQQQYMAGIISETEYTQKALNEIYEKMLVNNAKLSTLNSVVNLYQALGAGYKVDDYSDPHYDNEAFDK
ncbi:TolC family protein [Francisella sp. XLW-1]|uniref:TolC family protein n=1 Tax=Francisella sp. XLW-1 TaxID=2610887 RepID=UPI00123E1188|nr:TolC family protein [Francisella sp. XLW-1]